MALTSASATRARASYIALSLIARRCFAKIPSRCSSSYFRRSDFANQPFTGTYEPGQPTGGPLGDAPIIGASIRTPKVLKQILDQYVIGQERSKKVLSRSLYNHYIRIEELDRREEEQEQLLQQRLRRERADVRPVEDEFPGQQDTIHLHPPPRDEESLGAASIVDQNPTTLEKTNILMLGPSGVGKTLMVKTLARVLHVPFSISDCTPFTQAGYIGEDAQVCVERLLAAANYDVASAERGIICLDEIDKIAAAKSAHGKDVGGEGVQQALLKIIEGTTLHIQAKQDKSDRSRSASSIDPGNLTGSPLHGGRYSSPASSTSSSGTNTGSPKGETYSVRTDNMLFICTGAFIGLHKIILNRLSKGSIGFGSPIRSAPDNADVTILAKPGSEESKMFDKHLPFFTPQEPNQTIKYNPLDLVQPTDLQKYGMIPELVGRIPVTTALSALDEEDLVRVLTEPRNSLIRQYEQLFQLSGVELCFTSGALREVARNSLGMGTGARGLRTCVERLLEDAMFEAPGSSIKHILITEAVAQRKQAPIYLARGQQHRFHAMIAAEEEAWAERMRKETGGNDHGDSGMGSFEEYREKSKASGVM